MKRKLARRKVPVVGAVSRPRLGPGDQLYVGGAFWAHPRSIGAYERAARAGCDIVVLFHDFIPLTFPGLASGRVRAAFERMLRLKTRTIAISEHTRTQLDQARREVGAPPHLAPATVVPLAHEFSAVPRNQRRRSRRPCARRCSPGWVRLRSASEPSRLRKNHARILNLWQSLAGEAGGGWPKLVVAGKAGWHAGEALRMLRRADRDAPYLWIEAPTDSELIWLYSRHPLTVFPSLAEGWGLPIGESLWFGKPCVASNATSMPEVGGVLCLYGDPHDIETFAGPIIRLIRDAEFHANAVAAIKASPLRTWAEAANEVAAAVSFGPRAGPATAPESA